MREVDSNHRSRGYGPRELPLLYPATMPGAGFEPALFGNSEYTDANKESEAVLQRRPTYTRPNK